MPVGAAGFAAGALAAEAAFAGTPAAFFAAAPALAGPRAPASKIERPGTRWKLFMGLGVSSITVRIVTQCRARRVPLGGAGRRGGGVVGKRGADLRESAGNALGGWGRSLQSRRDDR